MLLDKTVFDKNVFDKCDCPISQNMAHKKQYCLKNYPKTPTFGQRNNYFFFAAQAPAVAARARGGGAAPGFPARGF